MASIAIYQTKFIGQNLSEKIYQTKFIRENAIAPIITFPGLVYDRNIPRTAIALIAARPAEF
ncbi:hypothetical protein [Planktothricoides raciborskii]|uniref:Uncharacterized protein n=2 Tax=Planktothricoides raciborskii TaxID=132608 RepID=A0AAU8JBU9_9CYAN|nr:hypothetical protein [Planktothricoides raciborskii]MBD2543170.1 hypothetical protein [Planktothricoides raciborskii FACHB-1370]MBD2580915.1 hypothetical protein [Planktothricoides raciborskii FACHB-1261]